MYRTEIKYPVGSKLLGQYRKAVKTGKNVRLQLLFNFVLTKCLLGVITFVTNTLKMTVFIH